jgi:hypothetical protein
MPAKNAPVAQLDRALDYESRGQEFESLRARQIATIQNKTTNPARMSFAAYDAARVAALKAFAAEAHLAV